GRGTVRARTPLARRRSAFRNAPDVIDPASLAPLGRTGVSVSRLGIGGGSSFVRAGADGGHVVAWAFGEGLRYFDTAPLYGEGTSETSFGAALGARPRDAFVVSTKVGREAQERFDYSAANVARSIERSCARLHLPSLDIALVHDVDP